MLKQITPGIMIALVLVGCAKKRSYDEVYKAPEIMAKNAIQTHEMKDGKLEAIKYLYVPMTMGTPWKVKEANPFYQGDEQVVRLEWSKEGLEVLAIEKDARFADNHLNDAPVLTIPGTHKSFRCKKDDNGDCSNLEEENDELEWNEKGDFEPDYSKLSVKELNMLDATNVAGSAPSGCIQLVDTVAKHTEVSPGVINIELEKSYQLANEWKCYWRNYFEGNFELNSFKVSFFYSIVRIDMLASKNFEVVEYPLTDHDEFGFFKKEIETLTDDYDSKRKTKSTLMNRWNPKRKNNELVYYLSKSFNKPKNKVLLDGTYTAINLINKGLDQANAGFKVKIIQQKDGDKEISPGDLRYNSLVLIDDPLANGLLGYGPSVANPYTGEIVQAHVNMYGGVLRSIIHRVYESAVDISEERKQAQSQVMKVSGLTVASEALGTLPVAIAQRIRGVQAGPIAQRLEPSSTLTSSIKALESKEIDPSVHRHVEAAEKRNLHLAHDQKLEFTLAQNGEYEGMTFLEKLEYEQEKEEQYTNIGNVQAPEFFPIAGTSKKVYPDLYKVSGVKKTDGTLKRWSELSKKQRDEVLDIVLVNSWISTLIHEFGHNLGLRHNFVGSFDKDNFFTKEEARDLGYFVDTVNPDEQRPSDTESDLSGVPAYSSVMDYSFSKFNQLRSLGKYDIAALRYAYSRDVEMILTQTDSSSNQTIKKNVLVNIGSKSISKKLLELNNSAKTKTTASTKLEWAKKEYAFCTDENAGLSTRCNRFDEGTSLLEIVRHKVKEHQRVYKYTNFRDGRLNFSAQDIQSYIANTSRRNFKPLRDVMENFELYSEFYGAELMAQGCSPEQTQSAPGPCGTINDVSNATKEAAQYFIDVLKTPDHICAMVGKDNPRVVVKYEKLSEIYDNMKYSFNIIDVPKTCFDKRITQNLDGVADYKGLEIVAENGKFLNGIKDLNVNYKYITDRAVLGTWPDKVLAMKMLYARRWKNRSTDRNHMALVDIPFVKAQVNNILEHFTMGRELANPIPFTLENGFKISLPYAIGEDYKIENLEDNFNNLKRSLGMSQHGQSNLIEILLKQVENAGVNYGENDTDKAFEAVNFGAVAKYRKFISVTERNPEDIYYFDGKTQYVAGAYNKLARTMLTTIIDKKKFDEIDGAIVAKVFKQRTNPDVPADFDNEKSVFFSISTEMQEVIISVTANGAQLSEAVFIQSFGADSGPVLFKMYSEKNLAVMNEVKGIKLMLTTTPAVDATDVEKELFEYDLAILADFATGLITDATIDFYKNKLKRLPVHQLYPNI